MKGLSRMLALVPFLMPFLAFAQTIPLQRGIDSLRQGNYEAALQQFKDAHALHPSDASIDNLIGITETKLGHIKEANIEYEAATRLDPKLPGPDKNLGFNYLGTGQNELAENHLKKALALDSTDPFVHYYLAILYLSTSRGQDAIPHIYQAQSQLENDPETALLAMKACLQHNASTEALLLLDSLERRSALSVAQEYEMATLLTEKQMFVEAVTRFQKISELQPASWENKYNLAIALLKAKQQEKALTLLVPLAAERPKDVNIAILMASAYEASGNYPLALQAYQKGITIDPHNSDRYLDFTQVLMDLNRFDEAAAILQQGISNVTDPYALTIRMGALEMMRGDREKAQEKYREAITLHPNIALGYVALAQTYMKAGDNEEALKVLTDGRKNCARDFALEYVFGLVSSQLGQQDQAMEALKSAETLGPTVAEPHYQLGILYMQRLQWNNAKEEFQKVLQLDPKNAPTYYQLSRAYEQTGDKEKANEMAKHARILTRAKQEEATKAEQLRSSGSLP